ncbi:MAG: M50 family metallopeptidase [Candidatus Electryoneaceae bacterium]|nr:M50 family metallopeptidase [Candidatus Electryoneaceae bacterium]
MISTILSFIVVIGVIIFVHELGHFIAAKLSGVRVEEFSLGFPPKMISRQYGETTYQLAWIPIGGYVKMSGMLDESFDDDVDPDDPRGFAAQRFGPKVFIITAGVLMNFLLAFFLYTVLTWTNGVSELKGTTVTMIAPDYPAEEAGIQEGDKIIEVAGESVTEWEELTDIVQQYPNIPIMIQWERNDSLMYVIPDFLTISKIDIMIRWQHSVRLMSAEITPIAAQSFNIEAARTDSVGKIGIVGSFITHPVGPLAAVGYGAMKVYWVLKLNVVSIKALLTGGAKISDLSGPVGIARMSGQSARSGLFSFVSFIALISVSIGFLNILPIPMLDGGHLVFILIESVIRRKIPDKIKIWSIQIGMAALLLLILVVSYHDILRIFQ